MTPRRPAARISLSVLGVLLTAVAAAAQTAVLPPPVGEEAESNNPILVSPWRVGLFGGATWGTLKGSEIEHADPGLGFDAGASYRVLSNLSVWGSYAMSSFDVTGQVTQLLDQRIQDSGRSATVDGSLKYARARAGVRVDGLREAAFRLQPYFVVAATYTRNSWKLTSVDQREPARPIYVEKKFAGYGRFGTEYRLAQRLDVDAFASYEVFKLPPAANASLGLGAGVHVRL